MNKERIQFFLNKPTKKIMERIMTTMKMKEVYFVNKSKITKLLLDIISCYLSVVLQHFLSLFTHCYLFFSFSFQKLIMTFPFKNEGLFFFLLFSFFPETICQRECEEQLWCGNSQISPGLLLKLAKSRLAEVVIFTWVS